jgi:hemoglobin
MMFRLFSSLAFALSGTLGVAGAVGAADNASGFNAIAPQALDIWSQRLAAYIHVDIRISDEFGFSGDAKRQVTWGYDIKRLVQSDSDRPEQAKAMVEKYRLLLTQSQANAVIDDTYRACEDSQISYHACNQLVVALAPFERAATVR